MDLSILLPDSQTLSLNHVVTRPASLWLEVTSTMSGSVCPGCDRVANRIHSRYQRTLKDLSCCGRRVCLHLHVRRFFCDTPSCNQQIFCERLPGIVDVYRRVTRRLHDQCRQIALEVGAESAGRILHWIAQPVSADAMLHDLHQELTPTQGFQVYHLGIDDWAWRKGQTYGTILVDLDRHVPLDLLVDRDVSTVAAWLKEHPEVRLVTRDRATGFQEAVNLGAPQAMQVADRWHLLKNLQETLERFLVRLQPQVRSCFEKAFVQAHQATRIEPVETVKSLPPTDRAQERFRQIKTHQKHGLSARSIALELGISKVTAQKYMALDACPGQMRRRARTTPLTPHLSWIVEQWNQGKRNAAVLFRHLRREGYSGGYTSVREYCARLRRHTGMPAEKWQVPTPKTLSWLLLQPDRIKNAHYPEGLHQCRKKLSEFTLGEQLFLDGWALLSGKSDQQLHDWLNAARKSAIPELISFAAGVDRDFDAVRNAITTPWSNGQVEGQVNRLKVLKRSMYGRASLHLLRARLLHRATR